jgi:hypothetical protein
MDDINDWTHRQHHDQSLSDVLRDAERSYQDLRAVESLTEEKVFDPAAASSLRRTSPG